jgi:hypothetical protein
MSLQDTKKHLKRDPIVWLSIKEWDTQRDFERQQMNRISEAITNLFKNYKNNTISPFIIEGDKTINNEDK